MQARALRFAPDPTRVRARAGTALVALVLGLLLASVLALAPAPGRAATAPTASPRPLPLLPLVPQPAELTRTADSLRIEPGAVIAVPPGDAGARRAAQSLAAMVWHDRRLRLVVRTGVRGAIVLTRSAGSAAAESYLLAIAPDGVRLQASGDAGFFYGGVSLWQLMTADGATGAVELPGVRIADSPRLAWRGLMLDVARHFAPVPDVKALIDQMAWHKLNVLHLHLSDDQGWRIEIKRYPELTRRGAWRTPPGGVPARYGGFYTQSQLRELVSYAAARHVTIVPEIDMPGHAQAVVAAYPQVGVDIGAGPGQTPRPAVSVNWGVNPYLFNADDSTLRFVEQVLDEMMSVFPSTFIHVGGDEAVKDQWKASASVQARMRQLGIANEDGLQSWFIAQVGDYLARHGRRLIGWDEILEGGLPATASVMSWRGVDGAIAAAKLGHDVVLAPAGALYLDNLQSPQADEPEGRLAQVPIKTVYDFDPVPATLDATQAAHVLGLEACLWTEYMPSRRHVEHAIFPRIAALAEVAWSPAAARNWSAFLPRLAVQTERYRRAGIAVADSAFAVHFEIEGGPATLLAAGHGVVHLSNQVGYGDIRYTVDGSEPTLASPRVPEGSKGAVEVALPAHLRATAFGVDGQPLAAVRERVFDAPRLLALTSSALTACPGGDLGLRVPLRPDATDWAPVFNISVFDGCWIYPKARLDGVRAIAIDAARLARNYGLAHEQVKVVKHLARTPHGELEVHRDACDGPLLASIALPAGDALESVALKSGLAVAGTVAMAGVHDLCLLSTAPIDGPLWGVSQARLIPGEPVAP